MTIVLYGCASILTVALLLSLYRMLNTPSPLDKAVALDVVVATFIGIINVSMALSGRVYLIPVLVVMTLVGFVGSTTVARFVNVDIKKEKLSASTQKEMWHILADQQMRRQANVTTPDLEDQ